MRAPAVRVGEVAIAVFPPSYQEDRSLILSIVQPAAGLNLKILVLQRSGIAHDMMDALSNAKVCGIHRTGW